MTIHYEPHPVTPERKAELRARGLIILDAVFAPEGWKANALQAEDETKAETPPARHPLDHDGDGRPGGSLPDSVAPRRRGRPAKTKE
jgi:hypothetical protein